MNDIPIHLVVEDVLSEEVLRKILSVSGRPYLIGAVYGKRGAGFIKSRINKYNQAADAGVPFLVLTDLDRATCPPELIADWFDRDIHTNLLFRIAIREVEAWVMADRSPFAKLLGVAQNLVPSFPDQHPDPKQKLIALARRSRKANIRTAIAPIAGHTAPVGPGYNPILTTFVREKWDPGRAQSNSTSLQHALRAVENFSPVYKQRV